MKKNTLIFGLFFVLLIALGIVLNNGINKEKLSIKSEKEIAAREEFVKSLVPGLEFDKVAEATATFLTENDTTITKKYNVTKGEDVVGIVYFGKTKGYKDNLEVAFGIDVKNNKIIGMKIVSSQETKAFLDALNNDEFYNQFESKDLTKFALEVNLISGATPNGGSGEIAPYTSSGIEKVMLLTRRQYSEDTGFDMPSGLAYHSKSLDFKNVDQYNYVLKLGDKEVNVVVNKKYEIVSISDETQKTAALEVINKNRMTDYIDKATVEGNTTTLVINTKGYEFSRIKTTVVITDDVIVSVKLDLSSQSYEDDYNTDYKGGNFDNAPDEIKNNKPITIVAGATKTKDGIIKAKEILKEYMEANK